MHILQKPTLKLPMVASCSQRTPRELRRWARTIVAAAARTPATTAVNHNGNNNNRESTKKASTRALNSNNKGERISVVVGWTMLPCGTPLWPSVHHKGSVLSLGLCGHNNNPNIPLASSSSSSRFSSYSSSGPEMGSENSAKSPAPGPPPMHLQSSKFLTLPTILTLGRVAAVPLLVSSFYVDSWWGTTATTSIFIVAAITDWLDGYIARKMKLGTAFGAFLDPVADKLMVAATLVLLCSRPLEVTTFGQVPWLLTVPAMAIIGREITMSAVREWAASQNGKLLEAVAVNNLGKWKTATQMTALTILLATRDSNLAGPGILVASGVTLLYVSAGLALWSLVVYMRKIWKVLLK